MSDELLGKIFALMCALSWAFAVLLFKRSGETLRPLALNLYKTVVTFILLLPILLVARIPLVPRSLTAGEWLALAASGVLGIAVSDSLFFRCLNQLGAGLTAIVDCLYSPMVMGVSVLFLGERPGIRQIGGAALVTFAVLAAAFTTGEAPKPGKRIISGMAYGAAAMLTLAVGVSLMKPVLKKAPLFWATEIRTLGALVALTGIVSFNGQRKQIFSSLLDRKNLRFALPGSFLGTFLSMTMWVAAFRMTDVASAAVLNQTSTVFIVILAALWLKEPFTRRRLLATLLAAAGSLLVML